MQSRRSFLGTVSLPAAAAAAGISFRPTELRAESIDIAAELGRHAGTAADVVDDESFWLQVQQAFTVDRTLINLNNGGVSPAPALVQAAMKRHQDYSNLAPTYTMWQILEPQREGTRQRMAREWGVDTEEVAFTRNASESLQILQFGQERPECGGTFFNSINGLDADQGIAIAAFRGVDACLLDACS